MYKYVKAFRYNIRSHGEYETRMVRHSSIFWTQTINKESQNTAKNLIYETILRFCAQETMISGMKKAGNRIINILREYK
jgi:hypothetical protein